MDKALCQSILSTPTMKLCREPGIGLEEPAGLQASLK